MHGIQKVQSWRVLLMLAILDVVTPTLAEITSLYETLPDGVKTFTLVKERSVFAARGEVW